MLPATCAPITVASSCLQTHSVHTRTPSTTLLYIYALAHHTPVSVFPFSCLTPHMAFWRSHAPLILTPHTTLSLVAYLAVGISHILACCSSWRAGGGWRLAWPRLATASACLHCLTTAPLEDDGIWARSSPAMAACWHITPASLGAVTRVLPAPHPALFTTFHGLFLSLSHA